MKILYTCVFAVLTACGGGDDLSEERRARPVQVSLYGDSLTYNRTYEITDHKFIAANYAQWGQGSFVPLDDADGAKLVVIRYGMADAIRLLTPEQTVENIQALVAQAKAKGQATIVVGMPCLDSELGAATAQAVRAVQDVDVTTDCGPVPRTTDGIHPTPTEHARMDAIIRIAVLEELNTLGGM